MKPLVTMRAALSDDDLLGRILVGPSWQPWRVLLMSMLGEELTGDERAIFTQLTERAHEPDEMVSEFWGCIGRRGGKSRAIACLVIYLACLVDHKVNLAIGERGVVLALAQNVKQARVVFNYVLGIIESTPALAEFVTGKTAETISLDNGIDIEIRAASFRGLRGLTCVACVCDEIAFWLDDESTNPASEILAALRPSVATTGGPIMHKQSLRQARSLLGKLPSRFRRNRRSPHLGCSRAKPRDESNASRKIHKPSL